MEARELSGCWLEASRADLVARELVRIRQTLDLSFHEPITALLREVESTSRLLRDLHDLFPTHRRQVPAVLYYLTWILPCFCRTLRDMLVFLEDRTLSAVSQWVLLRERLSGQGGFGLVERFLMSVRNGTPLLETCMLTALSSPMCDPMALERLRVRVLNLRLARGIPPPALTVQPPTVGLTGPVNPDVERPHWAEKIFDEPPHSTTGLRHRRSSRCFGPSMMPESLNIPPGSRVLFKLPFDKNRLSLTLYLHADGADVTRLLCRSIGPAFNPLYSCYGVHELSIRRKGSSLQFRRWSNNRAASTLWAALFFKTWERMKKDVDILLLPTELVLFHCAFVALKARCPLTVHVGLDDYRLAGERRIFQGQIVDDGFEHYLAVYQDLKHRGLRMHAGVWSGVLKRCPVWTAFITYQYSSPSWLERHSRHRIWIKDIQPYVFCKKYKARHQRRKGGEFEIYFVTPRAADEFERIFTSNDGDDDAASLVMDVPQSMGASHMT